MTSADMYAEQILDYYRHPRNFGRLDKPDISFRDKNPLCGDEIQIDVHVKDEKIADIKYSGTGCAISQAASGMLTELVKGKPLEEIQKITKEDLLEAVGIKLSPVRLKCALLSLKVLKTGIYRHLGQQLTEEL